MVVEEAEEEEEEEEEESWRAMREDKRLLRVSALTGMVNENYTGFKVLTSKEGRKGGAVQRDG